MEEREATTEVARSRVGDFRADRPLREGGVLERLLRIRKYRRERLRLLDRDGWRQGRRGGGWEPCKRRQSIARIRGKRVVVGIAIELMEQREMSCEAVWWVCWSEV